MSKNIFQKNCISFFDTKVKLITIKKFEDNRGSFLESYSKIFLKKYNINANFVQDNISFSKKKFTIRGLHFQSKPFGQAKLITVLKGKILDVFVDIRKNSKHFGHFKKIIMSSQNNQILFIPEGFAHGFLTLANNTEVLYKVSNFYSPNHEKVIKWDDTNINIDWNVDNSKIIISKKDLKGKSLNFFKK